MILRFESGGTDSGGSIAASFCAPASLSVARAILGLSRLARTLDSPRKLLLCSEIDLLRRIAPWVKKKQGRSHCDWDRPWGLADEEVAGQFGDPFDVSPLCQPGERRQAVEVDLRGEEEAQLRGWTKFRREG